MTMYVLLAIKRSVFGFIFLVLDWIFPKDDKIIVFGSAGGRSFNGNPRAVFEYVIRNRSDYRPRFFLKGDVDITAYDEALREYAISNRTFRDVITLWTG